MRKLTTQEFIEKAKKVHGNKYNYSKVEYIKSGLKVCIICPEREVIYTLDGKYYKLYYFDCYYEYELAEGPLEVYPVEKTITVYEY